MKLFDEEILQKTKEYVEAHQRKNGRAPSLRDILRDNSPFFKSSLSKVQRYLLELKRRGLVVYDKFEGIKETPNLFAGKTRPIPLIGECPCGEPILAVENIIGTYALPEELFGATDHFMLKAKGSSMIEKGISDGDIMVVRQQNWADIGDIVIARVNEEEATAKIYTKSGEKYILKPANNALNSDGTKVYKDIIPKGEWEILGIVDNVIHRIK